MVTQQSNTGLWTVNRIVALVLGIVFLLVGIIGFFSPFRNQSANVQQIFGIFDTDLAYNIVNTVVGIVGIIAAFTGQSRTFNQVFGVLFTLLGILSLIPQLYFPANTYNTDSGLFLGVYHANAADHVLQLVAGIIALLVGFLFAGSAVHTTPAATRDANTTGTTTTNDTTL
jgi:uncharacterized membrane protein HdeD (DUF308 family)